MLLLVLGNMTLTICVMAVYVKCKEKAVLLAGSCPISTGVRKGCALKITRRSKDVTSEIKENSRTILRIDIAKLYCAVVMVNVMTYDEQDDRVDGRHL